MEVTVRIKHPWLWSATLGATALLVVGMVWAVGAIQQHEREQRFLTLLDIDPSTDLGELPDEQLLASFRSNCEQIERGWTLTDALSAAARNWEGLRGVSDITQEQC